MEERHVNQALIKDLEKRLQAHDLYSWIDEQAEMLAKLGFSEAGVNFTSELLLARGIAGIQREKMTVDACIRFDNGQYHVSYKDGLPDTRVRFAIAHEIGHTYWFESGAGEKPLSPLQSNATSDPSIEYLCDRFAAALLLPRANLLAMLGGRSRAVGDASAPPLHLIPTLARRFRVNEQTVARRLFFQLLPLRLAIMCVRLEAQQSLLESTSGNMRAGGRLLWCALPAELQQPELVNGIKIPLRTHDRTIPCEMIPRVPTDVTEATQLDGRWWEGLQGQPTEQSRIPLRRWPSKSSKLGYALRCNSNLYIAHPF